MSLFSASSCNCKAFVQYKLIRRIPCWNKPSESSETKKEEKKKQDKLSFTKEHFSRANLALLTKSIVQTNFPKFSMHFPIIIIIKKQKQWKTSETRKTGHITRQGKNINKTQEQTENFLNINTWLSLTCWFNRLSWNIRKVFFFFFASLCNLKHTERKKEKER